MIVGFLLIVIPVLLMQLIIPKRQVFIQIMQKMTLFVVIEKLDFQK
jgi:hypothetical protein